MKRIGFFGLSSPVGYDYKIMAPRTKSDGISSPNPILEGAFGAMLLYDELWFLSESLCPANLRYCSFVRFIDTERPEIFLPNELPSADDTFCASSLDAFHKRESLLSLRRGMGEIWTRMDNHTHLLLVKGREVTGNCWRVDNVISDLLVLSQLGNGVELVVNSYTSRLLEAQAQQAARSILTELLVLDGIPNFLTEQGPYHQCVEDVRNDRFLTDFRQWMANTKTEPDRRELLDRKKEVERKLEEAQRDVFLKHMDPATGYTAAGKTLLGLWFDSKIPLLGALVDFGTQLWEEKLKQPMRWQGFVVSARHTVRSSG